MRRVLAVAMVALLGLFAWAAGYVDGYREAPRWYVPEIDESVGNR